MKNLKEKLENLFSDENAGPVKKEGLGIFKYLKAIMVSIGLFIWTILKFLFQCFNWVAKWRISTKFPAYGVFAAEIIIFALIAIFPITGYYAKMVTYRDSLNHQQYEMQQAIEQAKIENEVTDFNRGWNAAIDSLEKRYKDIPVIDLKRKAIRECD